MHLMVAHGSCEEDCQQTSIQWLTRAKPAHYLQTGATAAIPP